MSAGSTTRTALSVLCAGRGIRGLEGIVSAENPPVMTDVEIVPGRSVDTGQTVYLAVNVRSPGRDLPLVYEWSVRSQPGSAQYELYQSGSKANFVTKQRGDYDLTLRVTDRRGRVASVDFPVRVTDPTHPDRRPTPEGRTTQRPCRDGDETLEEFSARCDKAMGGVSVPEFDCDDVNATEPPLQNDGVGKCSAPNVLNHECDPGSHFHMLHGVEGDEIYIAAHCRKIAHDGNGDGQYGDVAVIQYNRNTGATCFYQALKTGLPHNAPAPRSGDRSFWLKPGGTPGPGESVTTASINCVRCHDTGPFIRSPYLAQLGQVWPFKDDEDNVKNPNHSSHKPPNPDKNHLPGTLQTEMFGPWNESVPYMFVGLNFQSWEAYSVENTKDSTCTGCHRMGMSRSGSSWNLGSGTSMNLGILATDSWQAMKLAHGKLDPSKKTSPIWMQPGQFVYTDPDTSP